MVPVGTIVVSVSVSVSATHSLLLFTGSGSVLASDDRGGEEAAQNRSSLSPHCFKRMCVTAAHKRKY